MTVYAFDVSEYDTLYRDTLYISNLDVPEFTADMEVTTEVYGTVEKPSFTTVPVAANNAHVPDGHSIEGSDSPWAGTTVNGGESTYLSTENSEPCVPDSLSPDGFTYSRVRYSVERIDLNLSDHVSSSSTIYVVLIHDLLSNRVVVGELVIEKNYHPGALTTYIDDVKTGVESRDRTNWESPRPLTHQKLLSSAANIKHRVLSLLHR